MARITFLGGAATVTGSRFLMTTGGGSVLVDCGMFQGTRSTRQRNWDDPVFARRLPDMVLLTHAHIDHTGYLPRLVGEYGYDGPILATAATVDLLGVMLPDSAKIQEEQAAYANKKGYSRHRPALPLYTSEDAQATLRLLRPVPYHEKVSTPAGPVRFSFAGHILGSAHITAEADDKTVVFSGDVGRWDVPVLKDPEPPPAADLALLESTYGNRLHAPGTDPGEALAAAVRIVVDRSGVMIIPAFSLGRTQEVLFRLRELEDEGRIPVLPVFLDSPMAIEATDIYRRHREEHDLETSDLVAGGRGPLRPERLGVTRSVEQSKRLNGLDGPAIIISASGMATAGRVVHHLKRLLPDPRTLVAFVGYQAAGTRGRALVDGAKHVKIHGQRVPVNAEIIRLDAFSAHADADELVRWLREAGGIPGRVALVHGEQDAREALAKRLRDEFPAMGVSLPRRGATVDV